MIEVIKNHGFTVTKWEEEGLEKKVISVGYLAKAAKNGISIGTDLIDYFLSKFPETDVAWLITGRTQRRILEEKSTRETKPHTVNEKAELAKIRDAIRDLQMKAEDYRERIEILENERKKPVKPAGLQKA